jgi:hypothetical protein
MPHAPSGNPVYNSNLLIFSRCLTSPIRAKPQILRASQTAVDGGFNFAVWTRAQRDFLSELQAFVVLRNPVAFIHAAAPLRSAAVYRPFTPDIQDSD